MAQFLQQEQEIFQKLIVTSRSYIKILLNNNKLGVTCNFAINIDFL